MKIFSLCFFVFLFFVPFFPLASDQSNSESVNQTEISDNQNIKAMEKEIADLKAKIKELEGKIDQLTKLVETLIAQKKDSKQRSELEKLNIKENSKNKTDEKPEYVYVSKSGKKYHKQDCRFLVGEPKRMTIEEAKKKKLEPCKFCFPESEDTQDKDKK
ncbi:MAG: hypothetical protein ACPL7B_06320 [Candidatus Poribacteria bacterium]